MDLRNLPKYIYFKDNRYVVSKVINGKNTFFKSFKKLYEAKDYRDKLIANNWEPLPLSEEEILDEKIKNYYKCIVLSQNHRQYIVKNQYGDYLGACSTIEEALYFRDTYYKSNFKETPRPSRTDLKTNNPYMEGLKYPLPGRLTPTKPKSHYGTGRIKQKGKNSFHVHYGANDKNHKSYYCACRTYEQAWYVRRELQKCNWDRNKLQEILDNYPRFYTKLLNFYKYIHTSHSIKGVYDINFPREFLEPGQNLEIIPNYQHLEDALYERDFLMANGWDYDLLVESIDDTKNPYYDMELPPYPQRKVRNIQERNYHEKELTEVFNLIYDEGIIDKKEICERVGIGSPVSLGNWLRLFWGSSWKEFKRISLTGENPINVLTKKEKLYTPDLSKPMPSNFNGWVQKSRSKKNPFLVRKGTVEYGHYPTEKMARQVVKKLVACNWDKNKLPSIQKSVGYQPVINRGNVYPVKTGGWSIRKKDKNRKTIYYGFYKDKRIAELTRDFLKENNWNKEDCPEFRKEAEYIISLVDLIPYTMFYGCNNTLHEYNIEMFESESTKKYYYCNHGKYYVSKYLNGTIESFGYYDTEDEAKDVVELLKLNNWDRTVLKIVDEMF